MGLALEILKWFGIVLGGLVGKNLTSIRDEVDLERLSSALVVVVEDTMQTAHASLWLADSGRSGRRGR